MQKSFVINAPCGRSTQITNSFDNIRLTTTVSAHKNIESPKLKLCLLDRLEGVDFNAVDHGWLA